MKNDTIGRVCMSRGENRDSGGNGNLDDLKRGRNKFDFYFWY